MILSLLLIVSLLVTHTSATTCDVSASAPTDGTLGQCFGTIPSGSSCTPSCNNGFRLIGVHSCLNSVLTEATCIAAASCTDTTNFVDAFGQSCSAWGSDMPCYYANSMGMTFTQMTALITGCCETCNTCVIPTTAPLNGTNGNCNASLSSQGSCVPTCDTGFTASGPYGCDNGNLNSVVCVDDTCTNDDSTTDAYGQTCTAGYDSSPSMCGMADDNDFNSLTQCCACAANLGNACQNISAPVNGAMGDCPTTLQHNTSCQFTCDNTYQLSSGPFCQFGVLVTTGTCVKPPCDASTPPANSSSPGDCYDAVPSGTYCTPDCDADFYLTKPNYCLEGAVTAGSCEAVVGCTDTANFVDGQGNACSYWVGKDCYDYSVHTTYSQAELNAVITGCCLTCNTCDTSNAPLNGASGNCTASMVSNDTCTPACNTGFTLSDDDQCRHGSLLAGVCVDNTCVDDNSTTDSWFDTCATYTSNTYLPDCGVNDDADFTAITQCCFCAANAGNACTINAPTNGTVGDCPTLLTHNLSCTAGCNTGYTLSADHECVYGTLTTTGVCNANACTATEVANSDKSTTGDITGNTGDVVAVVCDTGYSGSGDATCGTDATFSTVTCTADPCDASAAPTNGLVGTCTNSVTSGGNCQPECDTGYTVSGTSTCLTGTLTSATCDANPCDASTAPTNGAVGTCTNSVVSGADCQPECDTGYEVSGTSTCLAGVMTDATCIEITTTTIAATTTASVSSLFASLWVVGYILYN